MILHDYKEKFNICVHAKPLNETHLLPYSPIHLFTFKKVAFTLAEVLITLGIVGVVAAITIPSLISKYQKHVLHNQFKQAYSILSQMHQRMLNDEVLPYEQFMGKSGQPESVAIEHINTMAKYLNGTVCDGHYLSCTKGNVYKNLNGVENAHIDLDAYTKKTILLNNGMTLWRGDLTTAYSRYYIDINGTGKGPNKSGYDLFTFIVDSNNKLIPEKEEHYKVTLCSFTKATQKPKYLGFGCTYYAAADENPDKPGKTYWKDFLK